MCAAHDSMNCFFERAMSGCPLDVLDDLVARALAERCTVQEVAVGRLAAATRASFGMRPAHGTAGKNIVTCEAISRCPKPCNRMSWIA